MAYTIMKTINFEKFHGAGNDFIMISDMDKSIRLEKEEIKLICHRRFGIGADGLIIVRPAAEADYHMHYYNSDGKESTMCGNGGRCVVAFTYMNDIAGISQKFTGPDGVHQAKIIKTEGNNSRITLQLKDVDAISHGEGYYILNTGSPHYVAFSHGIENTDIKSLGRKIRFSQQFAPEGLNVNFVEEISGKLYVRTYERGVEDETLSCGTGVTASALAYAENKNLPQGAISIITKGGELQVSFNKENQKYCNVWLTGPTKKVFEGIITL